MSLRHRVVVTYEAEAEGRSADDRRRRDSRQCRSSLTPSRGLRHAAGGDRQSGQADPVANRSPGRGCPGGRVCLRIQGPRRRVRRGAAIRSRATTYQDHRLERHGARGRALREALCRGAPAHRAPDRRHERIPRLRLGANGPSARRRWSFRRCSRSRPSTTTTRWACFCSTASVDQFIPPRKGQKHALRVVREVLARGQETSVAAFARGQRLVPVAPRAGRAASRELRQANAGGATALDQYRPCDGVLSARSAAAGGAVSHGIGFSGRRTISTRCVGANRKHDVVAVRVTDRRESEFQWRRAW